MAQRRGPEGAKSLLRGAARSSGNARSSRRPASALDTESRHSKDQPDERADHYEAEKTVRGWRGIAELSCHCPHLHMTKRIRFVLLLAALGMFGAMVVVFRPQAEEVEDSETPSVSESDLQ